MESIGSQLGQLLPEKYYVKLVGNIPEEKQWEFEQACRLFSQPIPTQRAEVHVTRDLAEKNQYLLLAFWEREDQFKEFLSSENYLIMKGAFITLGELSVVEQGTLSAKRQTSA